MLPYPFERARPRVCTFCIRDADDRLLVFVTVQEDAQPFVQPFVPLDSQIELAFNVLQSSQVFYYN